MNDPQPSFYAVIPASVRYNKNLEAHAKLLYGEITALANQYGYCWASNGYFANLYEVDVRTIKRWLDSLKKEKLIKVEIEANSFPQKRKIWVTPEIQKMFTKGHFCHGGGDKNVPHNNKDEYEKKNNIKRKAKEASAPITYDPQKRELQGITEEDVKEWQKAYTSINVRKEISKCTIWARDTYRKNYRKSLMKFFQNAEKSHTEPFKERTEPEKEVTDADIQANQKKAKDWEVKASEMNIGGAYAVQAAPTKIVFALPGNQGYAVNYAETQEEFDKKCHVALKRIRLITGEK